MPAMPVESRRRLLGHKCEKGVFKARGRFTGLPAQVVESTFRDQAPAGDHTDPVGHSFGDLKNVCGHDDGATLTHAPAQHVLDLPRGARVETSQRLVENDEFWVV